ncbi:type IV pilin N-terminal domain-containing protein [Natronosalvus caseinilyticus]|uniref:type IV pilin N-terminal domain-containing protein n=1 Tax=Natronosalvus caseinilyticus TaxID=2953747 RepID=UPI0028AE482B|nr:type IV pilin N-terminal domain-containing protein [Natronosalvus caseinilyticus]
MQMESKIQTDNESSSRAVSPVIGVILMVAITVILAAVIAAFVLDLGQGQSGTANAGVSISDGEIQLTDKGNSDKVVVTVKGASADDVNTCSGGSWTASGSDQECELSSTGDRATFDESFDATAVAVSGDDENVVGNHEG